MACLMLRRPPPGWVAEPRAWRTGHPRWGGCPVYHLRPVRPDRPPGLCAGNL